ncbi:MAG: T9SS type A sorting domain-containing protein [Bacteroidia bacterium]
MKTKLLSTLRKASLALLFLVGGVNWAFAQSPANDFCGSAASLTVYGSTCGSTTSGDVTGATQSLPPITCNSSTSSASNDVWYKFVATATAHTITTTGAANFDAVVELRDGSCTGNSLSCADATLGGQAEVLSATSLTVGTTYYIRVYNYGGTTTTPTFTICITTPAPSNDICANATPLTVYGATCGNQVTGNVAGATQSLTAAPCAGTADDDVWYSFVATSTQHNITVVGSANFDAVVNLRSGTCGATPNVTCKDGSGNGGTEVINASGLIIGDTYLVRVYHYWGTLPSTTTFTICITTPAPVNDNCAGAVPLTVHGPTCGGTTTGNVLGATQSLAATCNGTADDDVWYKFTATATAHDITVVGSASFDAVIDLRSGSCNGTNISCKDATFAGGTEVLNATGLTIGTTYYLRVYHWASTAPATTTFTICVTTPAPANNECAAATALTVYGTTCGGAVTGNVAGATQSLAATCAGTADDDVWYSFVATSPSHIITVVGSASFDAVVDLRSGSCNGTNITCSDATGGGGTETMTATGLTPGSTYYVRVYHYFAAVPATTTFTICVTTPTPANDNCAGATTLTVYGATCGGATTGNVAGATQSLTATCAGTADDDVWFKFVATATSHDITVTGSASFDAVVDLRSGSCNGTNISCEDSTANGGTEDINATGLTIGNTYYVRVYHWSSSVPATTTFTICVTTPTPPAPANDNCAGATALTVYGATCGNATTGDVTGATESLTSISCNNFTSPSANDVWYSFVATSTQHNITVIGSTGFDPVVDLRTGSCNGTNVNCADANFAGGTEVINATGLTVGNTYFVRVYDYGGSPSTPTFTICITTPPPVNDDCSGAISLTVFGATCGGATTGNVASATQSLAASCNGTADDDVWYSFVATSTTHNITVVGSASFDAVIDLRSGACNGTNISCEDSTFTGGTEVLTATGLTVGTTYYVRVYHWYNTAPATTTFTICVTTPTPPAPANDNCSGATALTVYGATCGGATTGNVTGATQSIAGITCNSFSGTADDDVWYSFVATSTNHIITVVGSASFDAVVDLRTGACSGTNVNCADATTGGGTETLNATGLTIGSTYYVRVYHYGSSMPSTPTFTICVTTPAPSNDDCSGATALTVYGATCGGATTGNVMGASQSIAAAPCAGTANDDVWYSFVATSTSHDITVVGSASFDAVIDLRSGSCNGTNVTCLDATGTAGTETLNATGLTVGATYYVRVYHFYSTIPATTSFTICVTTPTPPTPPNDNCAGATSLTVYGNSCGGATTGNVASATQSIPALLCNGLTGTSEDDVWYSFVATATSHNITVVGSANFDAVVDLRSGACSGTNINCADSSATGGTEVIIATGLTIGNTYYVRVYDYGSTTPSTTTFTICVTTPSTTPPPNNNCSGATTLTVYGATCGGSTTGDVAGATQSLAAISCNGQTGTANDDVWYKFVATSTTHDITVQGSASLNAVVDMRLNNCSGANVGCADATGNGGKEVINATGLTIGSTYFVRVYDYGTGFPATTTFTICVTTPTTTPPANDDCANATTLTVYGATCGSATTGDVAGATQSIAATPCTGTADDDVWYKFVATAATHDITVVGSVGLNAVVNIRTGACTGTNLACEDSALVGGTEVLTATGLTIGTTYYVRVYDFGSTAPSSTTFTICVTTPTPSTPSNDNCDNATALTVYGTTCGGATTGDVAGATQSLAAISCNFWTGTANDDVWYSFVATSTTHDITVVGATGFDPVVDLRTGACTGTNVDCADATFGGGTEVINATGLTVGNTYYVRVYHYSASIPTNTTFTICVTTPTPSVPANDECTNADTLTVYGATCGGVTNGTVGGATQSAPAITCNGFTGTADDDVWYSFVATANEHDITVVGSSSLNAVVELLSGACNGTNVDCADATLDGGTEVINATGLTIGSTYYVRVYDYDSVAPNTTAFTICVTTPSTSIPQNDDCANAQLLTVYGATCGAATNGDINGATQSVAPITCNGLTGTTATDVWYSFVATGTTHNVTVVGSDSLNAVIDIRSGACSGTNIDCANATTNGGAELVNLTSLTAGATYYVRVYHYGSTVPATTTFTICVTTPSGNSPSNDECAGATPLTVYDSVCGGTTTGNVAGATQSIAAITCGGSTGTADDDVWYSFVATDTTHDITVVGSTGFDAVIDLRSGSCNGTNINCADASFTGGTEVLNATGLTVGATYFVRVYHYSSSVPSTTTFTICVTTPGPPPPAPANDECAGAVSLTAYGVTCGGTVTGNVAGATQSLAATCGGTANDDVWYSFVATAATHNITVIGSAGFDAVIDLLGGTCNGNNISCADTSFNGGTEVLTATNLTIGTTYLVRVYHYGAGIPSTTSFSICVTTPCAAPNTTVTPSSATICAGNSATLTANGADSYAWAPPTGLNTTTGPLVTANPTATTTYTVTGTFNGCSSTQVVTVTVDPAATASISQLENLLTSTPGASYQWYLNGIAIPGATAQSYLATQNGNYTVMVTNSAGCTATSPPFPIISFLGIDKLNGGHEVVIYPNPFSTSATIEIKGAIASGDVTMVVMDMIGRELKTISLSHNASSTNTQNTVQFTIERNDLANGMYFYKLVNNKDVIAGGKFTVQ